MVQALSARSFIRSSHASLIPLFWAKLGRWRADPVLCCPGMDGSCAPHIRIFDGLFSHYSRRRKNSHKLCRLTGALPCTVPQKVRPSEGLPLLSEAVIPHLMAAIVIHKFGCKASPKSQKMSRRKAGPACCPVCIFLPAPLLFKVGGIFRQCQ